LTSSPITLKVNGEVNKTQIISLIIFSRNSGLLKFVNVLSIDFNAGKFIMISCPDLANADVLKKILCPSHVVYLFKTNELVPHGNLDAKHALEGLFQNVGLFSSWVAITMCFILKERPILQALSYSSVE